MLAKVKETIKRFGLLLRGERVVVAVSGGPDSVALLHCLKQLGEELELQLHVVHLNHMFRGEEALAEARFVAELASRWGLPVTVEHQDVKKLARELGLSSQEAGRIARYRLLDRVAQEIGAPKIALGHHGDDQAETLLIRLLRGSGTTGLRGMAPRRGPYIRPLLWVRRWEIEEYCRREGLTYCQDPSNTRPVYLRNKIRLELLPLLEREYNPGIGEALMRTGEVLREEDAYLEEQTLRALGQIGASLPDPDSPAGDRESVCPLAGLLGLPLALQRRAIRHIHGAWAGKGIPLSYDHVDEILTKAAAGERGNLTQLPGGAWALVRQGQLVITGQLPPVPALAYSHPLAVPGDTLIPELGKVIRARICPCPGVVPAGKTNRNEAWLDYDLVPSSLEVRARRPGDRFRPLGLKGSKKLKDFFIDNKVPPEERERVPIIASREGILWVAGWRTDERYKITDTTRNLLHLVVFESDRDKEKGQT